MKACSTAPSHYSRRRELSCARIWQRRRRAALYQKAEGAYVWDEIGTRYTDYVGSWGPRLSAMPILEVIEAVREAALGGLSFARQLKAKLSLPKNAKIMPSRAAALVSSGTEATMTAIRLARGFTGRDKIIKFEGCYHGHSDSLLVKAGSGLLTFGNPSSAGVLPILPNTFGARVQQYRPTGRSLYPKRQ